MDRGSQCYCFVAAICRPWTRGVSFLVNWWRRGSLLRYEGFQDLIRMGSFPFLDM